MKKIKVGLTLKIFLAMMIGFLMIFGYSFNQEIERYKNNFISLHSQYNTISSEFATSFYGNYGNVTPNEMYENFNQLYQDNGNTIWRRMQEDYIHPDKYVVLIDETFEVEEIKTAISEQFGNMEEQYISIGSDYYDLAHLSEEQLKRINQLIPTITKNTVIQISGVPMEAERYDANGSWWGFEVIKTTYLQIGEEIIIDEHSGRMAKGSEFIIQTKEYLFGQFDGNSLLKNLKGEMNVINNYYQNQYQNKVTTTSMQIMEASYKNSLIFDQQVIKNGKDTYIIYSISMNVQKEEAQTVGISSLDGTVGYVEVFYDLDSKAFKACFENNKFIYLMTIVFVAVISVVVSMMITKRIKEIARAASAISKQKFDVVLNEKGTDELAILSKNINSMSKQLDTTISSLHEEIERVKKLENVRTEFIAAFTHEIKTPLTIINGNIELLEKAVDKNKKDKYLLIINKEIQKIDKLVFDMLQLSRLELKIDVLDLKEYALEDLLLDAIDDNHSLIKEKAVQIDMKISENEIVKMDKDKMIIAINNLLSNAIRHCRNNGKIIIRIHGFEFWIENEGEAIDGALINELWNSFVSGSKDGTGLGLAIVKNILDLHGFSYGVENTDIGVKFWINFVTVWDSNQRS